MLLGFLDWLSFSGLLKWFHDAIVSAWDWFVGILSALGGPLLASLGSALTTASVFIGYASTQLAVLRPYFNVVNAWFPLDLLFVLVSAYSAFWLALTIYRSIKKWIPTVSG